MFKKIHLLEICMKGVYWKVCIEEKCKLQKNRHHIHTFIVIKAHIPPLFSAALTFSLSVLLEKASIWPWATPCSPARGNFQSLPLSLTRAVALALSYFCQVLFMSAVELSCCMPTAPAGVGESEPRQLPERANGRQRDSKKKRINRTREGAKKCDTLWEKEN